jgi:hypothetical protein
MRTKQRMPTADPVVKVDKSGKVPVYTVRKILTDEETHALKGKFMEIEHFPIVLKEDGDVELSNFYKSEYKPTNEIKVPAQYKTNDYMILNSTNSFEPKRHSNQELLDKMNKILEMFEDQKEIKTGQKNEEIVLYCFLGIFVCYILDTFVNIGRYSR